MNFAENNCIKKYLFKQADMNPETRSVFLSIYLQPIAFSVPY